MKGLGQLLSLLLLQSFIYQSHGHTVPCQVPALAVAGLQHLPDLADPRSKSYVRSIHNIKVSFIAVHIRLQFKATQPSTVQYGKIVNLLAEPHHLGHEGEVTSSCPSS